MKKLLSIVVLLIWTVASYAQQDVTKFLGIPVDGTKSAMIQKLKAKGFTYNQTSDYLEGEFNGSNVIITIGTNNNKVYRVMVMDANDSSEGNIKIRFNNLVHQFNNNQKYKPLSSDFILSEKEDISYEMLVHNKRYEADYVQLPTNVDEEGLSKEDLMKHSVWFMIAERYGKYRIFLFYDNGYNQANGEDL